MAIFGDGYDELFDEEDEDLEEDELYEEPGVISDKKKIDKIRNEFEHVALVESFCTANDDIIRNTDIPERLQEWLKNRKSDIQSTTIRLISSGIFLLKERSPDSICAMGI